MVIVVTNLCRKQSLRFRYDRLRPTLWRMKGLFFARFTSHFLAAMPAAENMFHRYTACLRIAISR
jgi:hypothetical protein